MIQAVGRLQSVSTHSRLKAAGCCGRCCAYAGIVSTHSRLKAAGFKNFIAVCRCQVSTHSRLKAAGEAYREITACIAGFQHTAA